MGKPAVGTMTWPGGTVYRSVVKNSRDVEVTSIQASEQPDSTMTYNKEGQTRSYAKFRKWERCWQCGIEFPVEKMQKYQGKFYCIPGGCHKDIAQLREKNG